MVKDKIQEIIQYGEAKHFSGYKECYAIGFITGIILGIIYVKIFS